MSLRVCTEAYRFKIMTRLGSDADLYTALKSPGDIFNFMRMNKRQTHRGSGKPFSALIQRKEALNFRKYKIGLDFFSPQIVFFFPFPMKCCCCSLLCKQLDLKCIPSFALDSKLVGGGNDLPVCVSSFFG